MRRRPRTISEGMLMVASAERHPHDTPPRAPVVSPAPSQQSSRGHTLAELLAVIAVLSVIAAIAVPRMQAKEPSTLALATTIVADAARWARTMAAETGQTHGIEVDATGNLLRLFRLDDTSTPAIKMFDVLHPVKLQPYVIDLDAGMFTGTAKVNFLGITGTMSGTCDDLTSITFDPAGVVRCADPVTVRISDATVSMGVGSHSTSVSFAALTGRVTIQ